LSLGQVPAEGKLLSVYVKDGKVIELDDVEFMSLEDIANGDEKLVDFLKGLLAVDPDFRPSAEEALSHPWLNY
jgi:hypothetical protein